VTEIEKEWSVDRIEDIILSCCQFSFTGLTWKCLLRETGKRPLWWEYGKEFREKRLANISNQRDSVPNGRSDDLTSLNYRNDWSDRQSAFSPVSDPQGFSTASGGRRSPHSTTPCDSNLTKVDYIRPSPFSLSLCDHSFPFIYGHFKNPRRRGLSADHFPFKFWPKRLLWSQFESKMIDWETVIQIQNERRCFGWGNESNLGRNTGILPVKIQTRIVWKWRW
jgi:hypothetical protein